MKIEWTDDIDFSFHVEGEEIIIDKCEGITPEEGLAIFPELVLRCVR